MNTISLGIFMPMTQLFLPFLMEQVNTNIVHVLVIRYLSILQVVTESQKKKLLEGCHSGSFGHYYANKTQKNYDKLSEQYYWPEMLEDVEMFRQSCDQCQKANRLYFIKCTCINTCDHYTLCDVYRLIQLQSLVTQLHHPLVLTLPAAFYLNVI